MSPGGFLSWPFAKLRLWSRSFVLHLQRSSSHFTNHLTTLGGASWKRHSDSSIVLAVSPLVLVSTGDLLCIVFGRLRYTDEKPAGATQGPVQGLWLVRSEVKGTLDKLARKRTSISRGKGSMRSKARIKVYHTISPSHPAVESHSAIWSRAHYIFK